MAAQSGIAPTPELSKEWSNFISNANKGLFKISIVDEKLQPAGTWTLDTSPEDREVEKVFDLFTAQGAVEDKVPAYYVVRISSPTSTASSTAPPFLFISYVPDHAPVRAKMLTASTQTTLQRHLGDSNFSLSIFATSTDDLTYESYLAHTRHSSAAQPLTAREQEMQEIRQAEAATADDHSDLVQQQGGRSIIFGEQETSSGAGGGGGQVRGALPWSDEAKQAVRTLNEGSDSKEVVQLEIDLKTETVVLSEPQPDSLSVPTDTPCYLFYRHPAGIVLIYSCPPKSPIKSRLVYSSAVLVFYKYAAKEFAGVQVLKKLETDDPTEVTKEWIDSELGPLATPANSKSANAGEEGTASGSSTPIGGGGGGGGGAPMPKEERPGFARPSRPGRRR